MKHQFIKWFAGMLAVSMCFAGTCMAEEAAEAAEAAVTQEQAAEEQVNAETDAQTEAVPEEETSLREVGEAGDDALSLELTNNTGKDIVYISIFEYDENADPNEDVKKMQQALIDQGYLDDVVDGSYGPKTQAAVISFREANGLSAEDLADMEMLTLLYGEYDDGNLLKEEETIKADETVVLFYTLDDEAEAQDVSAEAQDAEEQAAEETEQEDEFALNPDYRAVLMFDGDEEEYVLHTIPVEDAVSAQICLKEGIAYIIYKTEGSEEELSTLESEKAVKELEEQQAAAYTETYDDYYYDNYSYDDYYYDDYYYDDYSYDDYSYDDYYYDDYSYDYTEDVDGAADGCIEDGLFW